MIFLKSFWAKHDGFLSLKIVIAMRQANMLLTQRFSRVKSYICVCLGYKKYLRCHCFKNVIWHDWDKWIIKIICNFFQRNHLGRSFWRCVVPSLCYCHKLIREVQLLLSQALVPPTVVGLMCSHRCSAYSVSFSPPVSHHIHWPCCGHLWLIRHSLFPHVRGWVTARWPPTVGGLFRTRLTVSRTTGMRLRQDIGIGWCWVCYISTCLFVC